MNELNIGGIYLPPFLLYAARAGLLYVVLRLTLLHNVDSYVWHPPLFKVCLFIILLAVMVVVK
ncbi:MAG: DUF1656 domain-containing protein [Candidatus Methylacidiphilales bacterium]|nr:DUF1656 domain-containing protein [Candidatus Methylacidiphilales bacterium]